MRELHPRSPGSSSFPASAAASSIGEPTSIGSSAAAAVPGAAGAGGGASSSSESEYRFESSASHRSSLATAILHVPSPASGVVL
jgi:hypothetical protein